MGNISETALSPYEIFSINNLYKEEIDKMPAFKPKMMKKVYSFDIPDIKTHMEFSKKFDELVAWNGIGIDLHMQAQNSYTFLAN